MAQEAKAVKCRTVSFWRERKLTISGVTDVHCSFDEEQVLLETVRGMLVVRGQGLHVERLQLEAGELIIQGRSACSSTTTACSRATACFGGYSAGERPCRCLQKQSAGHARVAKPLLLGVGIGAVYDMMRALRLHFGAADGQGGAVRYAVLGNRAGGLIRVRADRGRRSAARLYF